VVLVVLTALVAGIDMIRQWIWAHLGGWAGIAGSPPSPRSAGWLAVCLGVALVLLTWLAWVLWRRSPFEGRWPALATVIIVWLTTLVAGIDVLHHRWDATTPDLGLYFSHLVGPTPPAPPAPLWRWVAGAGAALALVTWLPYAVKVWLRGQRRP
jgi:hypothetical protein